MSTAQQGTFATDRRDAWWLGPLLTVLGLGAAGIYLTWAAFQGEYYEFGPYLSPLYSPLFKIKGFPLSPALLILWAPGGFRATCYYYRKAYYRSFFMDPVACAVGEPHSIAANPLGAATGRDHNYRGEAKFPFIIQNIHRYFMYLAVIFIFILWYDVIRACIWDGHFGIGVGTLIMAVNAFLLGGYTLGCHSFRHLIGGKQDCWSCVTFGKVQHKAWQRSTRLNENHMLFAWLSLFTVSFTDFYIRMCSMGYFKDVRLF